MNDRFRMLPSYHYEDNTDGMLLKSVGMHLRDYKIEGNSVQDGTPSPDNPIEIQSIGDLITSESDENYGKYKIPVIVSGENQEITETNIYLDEPLRKIGDYADYINFKGQKVVRNVYCGKFNDVCRYGSGSQYATGLCRVQGILVPEPKYDVCPLSNALECYDTLKGRKNTLSIVNSARNIYAYFHIDDVGLEPVTQTTSNQEIGNKIRSYIEDKDIEITYALETKTEETIKLPEILTHKGTNIITVGTELQPSAVNYQYYKGGK